MVSAPGKTKGKHMKTNLKTIALVVMAGLSFAAFAAKKADMPKWTKASAAVTAPADAEGAQKKRPARKCRAKKAPKGEPVMVTGMTDSAE